MAENTYYISLSQDSNQEAVSTGLDKKLEKYSVAKKGKDVSIIKMPGLEVLPDFGQGF